MWEGDIDWKLDILENTNALINTLISMTLPGFSFLKDVV